MVQQNTPYFFDGVGVIPHLSRAARRSIAASNAVSFLK
jgi:hypothetical protein